MNVQVNGLQQFERSGGFSKALLPLVDKDGAFMTNDDGYVKVGNKRMVTNSLLRKDEWEQLDSAVVEAATGRLNAIQRLQDLGLTFPLDSIGVMTYQWNVSSQMTRATVNLTGQTTQDLDKVDYLLKGVPIPVIHKAFNIGERSLEASRRMGQPIDTVNAYEASRVVAEELERMFFDGAHNVELNQDTIYGVTNEPNVNTGSAEGDFGTLSNVLPTFTAMVSDAADANMHGPFEAWVYKTQYIEMMEVYTDGSGQSAMERVLNAIPSLNAIHPADYLSAGEIVLAQMTPNVLGLALYDMNMIVEWPSGDGMTHHFKIMTIGAPVVRSDYDSQSGIVYYTGA